MTTLFSVRRGWPCVMVLAALAVLVSGGSTDLIARDEASVQAPNYALASQWTVPKINKMVFDTQVTPHWLETSDRFWYSFETATGSAISSSTRPGVGPVPQ